MRPAPFIILLVKRQYKLLGFHSRSDNQVLNCTDYLQHWRLKAKQSVAIIKKSEYKNENPKSNLRQDKKTKFRLVRKDVASLTTPDVKTSFVDDVDLNFS